MIPLRRNATWTNCVWSPHRERRLFVERALDYAGRNICVLIDAPTSRKAIIAGYIDDAYRIMESVNKPEQFRLIIPLHQRYALFGECHEKLKSKFKSNSWAVDLVQVERNVVQQAFRGKPGFVFLVSPARSQIPVPGHIVIPRGSGREKTTLRCVDRHCRHRPKGLMQKLGMEPNFNEEFAAEDTDVDLLAQMQACADDEESNDDEEAGTLIAMEEEVGGEEQTKVNRDYKVDVWTFAHAATYYKALFEFLGGGAAVETFFVFSATAHPRLVMLPGC